MGGGGWLRFGGWGGFGYPVDWGGRGVRSLSGLGGLGGDGGGVGDERSGVRTEVSCGVVV